MNRSQEIRNKGCQPVGREVSAAKRIVSKLDLPKLVLLLSFAVIGCQSESEPMPEVTVNVPEKFEQDGVAWQKQTELQTSDTNCLAKFFSLNQDLAGSPEFERQPTVFTSGKNDRRFYWFKPTVDGVRWQCVEFRKRKFLVSDGTETPFD